MLYTKYRISKFDPQKAVEGALCVMVDKDFSEDTEDVIENLVTVDNALSENPYFCGEGICKYVSPSTFIFSYKSKDYRFNDKGLSLNINSMPYKLLLATVENSLTFAGNVVESGVTNTYTRGSISNSSPGQSDVLVDTLNARDLFAVNALRGMFDKILNPSTLSSNEMAFYCNVAYQWAANMMAASAESRALLAVNEGLEEEGMSTRSEPVVPETNTDKILYNISLALEVFDKIVRRTGRAYWSKQGLENQYLLHTDEAAALLPTAGTYSTILEAELDGWEFHEAVYKFNIDNNDLTTWLTEYVKHTPTNQGDTKTKVGLDDLIKAISDISISATGGNTTVDVSSVANAIAALGNNRNVLITDSTIGKDSSHPLYIEGGVFPTRSALAAIFTADAINDFLTFNSAGAVGHSTKTETKKAILGYLNDYATLNDLGTAIFDSIKSSVDTRIQLWLLGVRVNINGTSYQLTVNNPD